jgi:hypothetical protein
MTIPLTGPLPGAGGVAVGVVAVGADGAGAGGVDESDRRAQGVGGHQARDANKVLPTLLTTGVAGIIIARGNPNAGLGGGATVIVVVAALIIAAYIYARWRMRRDS